MATNDPNAKHPDNLIFKKYEGVISPEDMAILKKLAGSIDGPVPSDVPRPSCDWTQDQDGVYHTGCKNAFFFDTGSAGENNAKFCQYCGGGLKVIDYTDPDIEPQEPLNIGRDVSDNSTRQPGE